MNSDDFIYVPAAQRSKLDDIILRVQSEKEKADAEAEPDPSTILEETLKKLDINTQISEKVMAMQTELEKEKKSGL